MQISIRTIKPSKAPIKLISFGALYSSLSLLMMVVIGLIAWGISISLMVIAFLSSLVWLDPDSSKELVNESISSISELISEVIEKRG